MPAPDNTMLNAFVPGAVDLPAADQLLIDRRAKAMGPAYRLFYEKPLNLVRGEDVWLYGADGTKYLDVYNNVASVGHSHPHVVRAISNQAATLCTHTRYLTTEPVAFAERLLVSFPEEIGHVMFTNSGSEANDLALRLAFDVTGGSGVIITNNAYHGTTHLIAGLSPSLGPGVLPYQNTWLVAPPLDADGQAFAQRVSAALEDMRAKGIKPAALLIDSIFTSDGVAAGPKGFLAPAAALMKKEGALIIADEVQPGFGRTGDSMWCFARHAIVPDMVTMGKPMGNGYPVAALALRPEVIADFGAKSRYFNTFGGNTIAMAAANAVLDVIENQDLIVNAKKVGDAMAQALRQTAGLGEVRAAGLMLAIDIIDANGSPDPIAASRLVNQLAQKGVLISTSRKDGSALKIRPPLTFSLKHLDFFMEKLLQAIKYK